jgi:hypothetical protein
MVIVPKAPYEADDVISEAFLSENRRITVAVPGDQVAKVIRMMRTRMRELKVSRFSYHLSVFDPWNRGLAVNIAEPEKLGVQLTFGLRKKAVDRLTTLNSN